MNQSNTLVLGIGNTLLSDEGVGIHVVEQLAAQYPDMPGVTWLDGGTLSFTLASYIEDHANLVVVDAARLDAIPGTVKIFLAGEMDDYLRGNRKSAHEVGLQDLLDIAHLAGHLPVRRALVGIEPENLDWGEAPSAPVARAIPEAAAAVLRLIEAWKPGGF